MTDKPKPFGYNTSWLAVRSSENQVVADAIGLTKLRGVPWALGLDTVYSDRVGEQVFVTPSIGLWTLIVGVWTGSIGSGLDGVEELVQDLSQRFGEAQAFSTDRIVEAHHWVLAKDGHLVRSLAWLGSEGAVLADKGTPTATEKRLNINVKLPSAMSDEGTFNPPDEQTLMAVAAAWSVNPTALDEHTQTSGQGFLAEVPTYWAKLGRKLE